MQEQWYSVHCDSQKIKDIVRAILWFSHTRYEISGAFDGWHIAYKLTPIDQKRFQSVFDLLKSIFNEVE